MNKDHIYLMIRTKLPNASSYHCSPSGDSEFEDAYNKALKASIPEGYKIRYDGMSWPVDNKGYTYIPVELGHHDPYYNKYMKLKEELFNIAIKIKSLLSE